MWEGAFAWLWKGVALHFTNKDERAYLWVSILLNGMGFEFRRGLLFERIKKWGCVFAGGLI